jgi:hypothetical protein
MTKRKLRVVTNSELRVRRRCQREHFFMYSQGYRPVGDVEALRFGSMFHNGREALWRGHGLEAAIEAAVVGAVDEYEAAKVRVLLIGYEARWGGAPDDFVDAEVEFRAPLINPATGAASRTYELGGKLDGLMESRFSELKTTSEDIGLGSVYWRKLTLDPQVSTYYAGARSLGREMRGCLYDVVRKPSLRPGQVPVVDDSGFKVVLDANGERVYCKNSGKAGPKPRETGDTAQGYALQTRPETPEEYEARLAEEVASNPDRYYQRGEVVRLEAEEREFAMEVWQLTSTMREAELSGIHPRNADACQRYGRLCGFFDVCCGNASLDDGSRFQRVENVHPELSPEWTQRPNEVAAL